MADNRPAVPGYEAVELLGFGAAGEVWLARERATGDPVALKRVRPSSGSVRPPDEAIRREAALLRGVEHPHLVRLRRVVPVGDELVLVLDHAGGGSLAALLARRGALTPGEVVTLGAPLAQALAAIHARGLVHGDVSPGNVLWTADGRPLLADLGVARLMGEAPAEAEATAGFVDPAVLRGADAGPATDVHGLAAVCFAALTTRPPYSSGMRRSLADWAPHVPAALGAAIEAALDPDPARRPDAATLAVSLYDACPAEPVRLVPDGGDSGRGAAAGDGDRVSVGAVAGGGRLSAEGDACPEAVTRRVRRVSVIPEPAPAGSGRRARRRAVAAPRREGVRRAAGPRGPRVRRRAHEVLPWRPVAGAAGVVVALVLAGMVGVAWAGADGPRGGAAPRLPAPVASSRRAQVPTDWAGIVTRLYVVRQQAFAQGDASLLDRVYAPGSPDLTFTQRNLGLLAERGEYARGVRLRVLSASPTSSGPRGPGEGRVTLDVVDRLDAATLVDASGATQRRLPGRAPAAATLTLVRVGDGWRIVSTRASATSAAVAPTASRAPPR